MRIISFKTETHHSGDKVYTINNNHEHAEDIKNLPDTQAVVDQLNENPQYRQVREIAEKAKVPDWNPQSEVDKAADEKLAQRDFEQLFMPPYEGADKVKIEKLTDSFSWTDEKGESPPGEKGRCKNLESRWLPRHSNRLASLRTIVQRCGQWSCRMDSTAERQPGRFLFRSNGVWQN